MKRSSKKQRRRRKPLGRHEGWKFPYGLLTVIDFFNPPRKPRL